jgi:SHS2 domain-containing protein
VTGELGSQLTYRFLPHTADIKVAFEAETLEELFADGTALMSGLLAGSSLVEQRTERTVRITAADTAELFLGYLRDLLYEYAGESMLPSTAAFERLSETELVARIAGEEIDPERHEHQPEVKAVTRHDFVVESRGGRWYAEVVFDV